MTYPNLARLVTRLAPGLIAAGAAAGLSCSLIVDFPECRTHADCAGANEPLACSAEQTCVTADEFPDCDSHQVCADAFGDDYLCGTSSTCISALTEECTRVVWPEGVSRDKVVFIGSLIPVSPPYDAITVPLQNAIELAIDDFNDTTLLPGGRKVAWIACDDQGQSEIAVTAARHLVEEVGAPAIIGPTFSEEVLHVAEEVTIPGGTLLISPTGSNKTITDLDDKGLVWRTIPSDVYQASALRDRLLLDLDPKPENIVILSKDDTYGNGLADDIVPALLSGASKVTTYRYADPTSFASEEELLSAYGSAIAGAFQESPDALVLLGTSEIAQLIGAYVKTWGELTPGQPLPRFILSHGAVPVMEDAVNQVSSGPLRETLIPLVEGTAPVIQDTENFGFYNIRYKIRFDEQDAVTSSSLSYDATMVVMFAMATVGEAEISGADISAGISRLVDKGGTAISFGSDLSFIKATVDTLAIGGNVDLRGVSGELDFDLSTGEVRTNIVGWDLTKRVGTEDIASLTPARVYALGEPPSTDGVWTPLP